MTIKSPQISINLHNHVHFKFTSWFIVIDRDSIVINNVHINQNFLKIKRFFISSDLQTIKVSKKWLIMSKKSWYCQKNQYIKNNKTKKRFIEIKWFNRD